ncbi:hypothetical protein [Lactococcus garvieae]|jgi:hypothetical protein|uniref:hypothetical protein n=1 Tax=Lactococcus garvieae TaxID=1363 RepID=UPI001CE296F7|nr:hypothetical protein [Lactococcus garvieae]
MTYEKQTWNKYDDLKTEEENIQNGAVVTDNRMNHMEDGISAIDLEITSHESNKTNPHSVTKEQVGLSNVSNYGIATEAEAIAGTSNAKYMTPSLTKKAAKSYVDKTDVGLSNVDNVKQASKSEFDEHTANKNNPHSVTATQVGAYTISETDAKFKLTINDSGAIAAGTDLDSLNIPGFYAISNKKPDTEILNYPKGVKLSGSGSIYAQVVVFKNASSTMIKQVFYDQLSTREYYRSFANNAWQEWQLAAIDSEVVHLTGDETIAGKKTFTDDMAVKNIEVTGDYKNSTDTEMIDLPLSGVVSAKVSYQRKNGVVFVKGGGNWGNFEAKNERFVGTLPVGFRPASDWPSGMNAMGGSQSMSAKVTADGKVGITSDIKKDGVYGGFSMSFPVE